MANIDIKKDDYKDNNESADCNLTRSDRPSLIVRGLGELVNQRKTQGIVVGGVTGKILIANEPDVDQDTTKLAHECS